MEWISKIKVPKKQSDVDGRLVVRTRFKIARQFLAPLTTLINLGFATKRRGKTAMGRAMSYMLLRCIDGEYPNLYVNAALVRLSEGPVPNPFGITAEREGNSITVQWEYDDRDSNEGYADDGVIVCAYNLQSGIAGINEKLTIRSDKQLIIKLPSELYKQTVHLYLLTHTRDKVSFSKSVYLGEFL